MYTAGMHVHTQHGSLPPSASWCQASYKQATSQQVNKSTSQGVNKSLGPVTGEHQQKASCATSPTPHTAALPGRHWGIARPPLSLAPMPHTAAVQGQTSVHTYLHSNMRHSSTSTYMIGKSRRTAPHRTAPHHTTPHHTTPHHTTPHHTTPQAKPTPQFGPS
jgi:hypothetical protein